METPQNKKKNWVKPSVQLLNIRRDTFSGSKGGAEAAGKYPGPPSKW
jgi:hypothetical protein